MVLSWDSASGATSYNVYRNSSLLGSSGTTSYNDTTVSPLSSYEYQVTATNGTDESSPSSSLQITTPTGFVCASYTSSNYAHVEKNRAYEKLGLAYAVGSNQSMGVCTFTHRPVVFSITDFFFVARQYCNHHHPGRNERGLLHNWDLLKRENSFFKNKYSTNSHFFSLVFFFATGQVDKSPGQVPIQKKTPRPIRQASRVFAASRTKNKWSSAFVVIRLKPPNLFLAWFLPTSPEAAFVLCVGMGAACGGGGAEGSEEDKNRNKKIEQQLKKDKKFFDHEIKLLLLGLCFPLSPLLHHVDLRFFKGPGNLGRVQLQSR